MHTEAIIHTTMEQSHSAFHQYSKVSFEKRAELANEIVQQLQSIQSQLIDIASAETNLHNKRLETEFERTLLQFKQYSTAYKKGNWLMPIIHTGKKDIRKTFVPLGPVVVYGASNFPFAYSTPGGDVASALAAGCSVVVKAHSAHLKTATLAAKAIQQAVLVCNLHQHVFQQIELTDHSQGKMLIQHPHTAAVSFTGSLRGGRQLYDWANERKHPIPVFAEMGSVNPVFILNEALHDNMESIATKLTASISNSAGQFCTKPGILIGIKGNCWSDFIKTLRTHLANQSSSLLLHQGIHENFIKGTNDFAKLTETHTLLSNTFQQEEVKSVIMEVSATSLLQNKSLHEEVFGPFALLVTCNNMADMLNVARSFNGQLTTCLMASEQECMDATDLLNIMQTFCGRIIINDVPTGVEVDAAMHHGGPYPSTTDSRFTAVGPQSMLRFVRPLAFQNFPTNLLPDELKDNNPLQLWRYVNDCITKNPF